MKLFSALLALIIFSGCAYVVESMGLAPLGQGPIADKRQETYVENHDLTEASKRNEIRRYLKNNGVSPENISPMEEVPSKRNSARSDIAQAILDGRVVKNMTKEQVIASWGTPCSLCGGGTHVYRGYGAETLVFGVRQYPQAHTYVFLEGGRVVGWSN